MAHAILYVDPAVSIGNLPEMVQTPTADIEHICVDVFGIAEARLLQDRAYRLPVVRSTREFVLMSKQLTLEAQNALLKLFEDPPESARFHMVVTREDTIIPTLRSRCVIFTHGPQPDDTSVFAAFLQQSLAEQLKEIEARMKQKDTVWSEAILTGAEVHAAATKDVTTLKSLLLLRRYAHTRGASNKMLLEELALTLADAKERTS